MVNRHLQVPCDLPLPDLLQSLTPRDPRGSSQGPSPPVFEDGQDLLLDRSESIKFRSEWFGERGVGEEGLWGRIHGVPQHFGRRSFGDP